jgi:membrane dipeptidase
MRLVKEMYPLVDAHQDVGWSMLAYSRPFASSSSSFMLTESSWRRSGLKWAWCTIFVLPEYIECGFAMQAMNVQFEIYSNLLAHYSGWLVPIGGRESIGLVDEFGGQTGISLLIEGADAIESPAQLEGFFLNGVRAMSLTWHHSNRYAGGDSGSGGITDFGRQLLDRAASLGIAIDISHLNKESFWDLIEYRKKHLPSLSIYASHSNAAAVCPHDRNLNDEQLEAMRDSDGCVGVVLLNSYLKEGWKETDFGMKKLIPLQETIPAGRPPAYIAANLVESAKPGPKLEDAVPAALPQEEVDPSIILNHIEHLRYMLGEDRVGIGSDFDGGLTRFNTPRGIDDLGDLQLVGEMIADRWNRAFALKVMGENWMGFWAKALP